MKDNNIFLKKKEKLKKQKAKQKPQYPLEQYTILC